MHAKLSNRESKTYQNFRETFMKDPCLIASEAPLSTPLPLSFSKSPCYLLSQKSGNRLENHWQGSLLCRDLRNPIRALGNVQWQDIMVFEIRWNEQLQNFDPESLIAWFRVQYFEISRFFRSIYQKFTEVRFYSYFGLTYFFHAINKSDFG